VSGLRLTHALAVAGHRWAGDLYRSSLVVVGLVFIGALLRWARIYGWLDPDEVAVIRKVHLISSAGVGVLIGLIFAGKLWAGHRKELSKKRGAR
jgi:hypothetical protein